MNLLLHLIRSTRLKASCLNKMSALGVLLLTACGVTSPIAVNTTEPAPVDLSNHIRRIGIYDQNMESNHEGTVIGLDEWIRHTDQLLTEAGRDAAMNGLMEELIKDPRFDTILMIETVSNVSLPFQDIPWAAMKDLCVDHGIDALFALSYFETDTKVTLKKARVGQKDLLRENVIIKGKEITLETLIENGWRIYDPFNKEILDEVVMNDQLVNKATGEDPFDAFQAVENRADSIISMSGKNGSYFGLRLQPYELTKKRELFIKGSENLEKAYALTQDKNWDAAKELWIIDAASTDNKISSRASHNLAVIHEFFGDLETALAWALKAYAIQESRYYNGYTDVLQDRLSNRTLIEEQLMK